MGHVYCTMLTPGFFHFFRQYHFFVLETFKSLPFSISGTYIPLSLPIILYCTTNATIYFFYPNGTYLILVDNVFSFKKSILEKLKYGVKPLGTAGKC